MANDNHQTPDRIPLAQYLFTRLSSDLNIRHVHGVPGDYTLTALDFITPESTNLRWVGNATELCAAYAADGYARAKTNTTTVGVGALVTSFGVGELSSLNALAGAYAERVPLVHVVGTPPRASQAARQCLHHTLGDGDHGVFARVYESVTVARAVLDDPVTAAREVDRVLRECVRSGRPVYVAVPTDMVGVMVEKPAGPLLALGGGEEGSEEEGAVERVAEAVVAAMRRAERPLVLVDGFTARFGVRDESVVDEGRENFHGVYAGMAGEAEVRRWVEGCDLVLRFGPLDSDINTFGFTTLPDPDVTVTFEKDSVRMGSKVPGRPPGATGGDQTVALKPLLQKILKRLASVQLPATSDPFPAAREPLPKALPDSSSLVDQQSFWIRLSSFLRSGDIVLAETGTAAYGAHSLVLPADTTLINSALWLSIGYALAAVQGAALAQRERMTAVKSAAAGMAESGNAGTAVEESAKVESEDAPQQQQRSSGRTILFTGDGSFQMTCQSLSDIIRNRLSVVVFVLNNDGYTVERLIHGADAAYNDVQPWRYSDAPWFFGAPRDDPGYPVSTWRVGTWGELEGVLGDERVRRGRGLHVVEVVMGVDDAPRSLVGFAEYVRRRNAGELGDGE
ncbi:Pyruvate decarboxylase [Lasiodiplodia theobromae]|uniref:Pyruvate decarboxylase n=1 Tax=Lasiodiplodia theobromae TaxID=45133 RepID=UPI0015C3E5D5|nr:Pyruvate decarboxylase [Lasiodiplodia theobromae]KAF4534950.1 Pyruvate decarboxylase [Lasiodiplodia theobromae]